MSRALHLANAYEDRCPYVLRIGNLIAAHQSDPAMAFEEAVVSVPADKLPGDILQSLAAHAAFGGYKQSGIGRETHCMMLEHYRQRKKTSCSDRLCERVQFDPPPVDRAHPGSKHHPIVNRHGTPLAVTPTGGNRHDVTQLLPLPAPHPHPHPL